MHGRKSARKPRTRNKPKTITRGRRVKYKQYNPNGHLKSHSVSEPANNPTQPQKGTGRYESITLPPTPPIKDSPRVRRRRLVQQHQKYRQYQKQQLGAYEQKKEHGGKVHQSKGPNPAQSSSAKTITKHGCYGYGSTPTIADT